MKYALYENSKWPQVEGETKSFIMLKKNFAVWFECTQSCIVVQS